MNEREQAIQILKRTREVLAQRLTERILEAEEEILTEAEGMSYLSEIETIYDQLGIRLAHVNQMLAHLPAPAPESSKSPAEAHHSEFPDGLRAENSFAFAEALIPATPALPAPGGSRAAVAAAHGATLFGFAAHARRGDVFAAAASLESLFGLETRRSLVCARVFTDHCRRDPSYVENAALLHNCLHADALSRAFGLLCDVLGLSGSEALSALMWWRTRTS